MRDIVGDEDELSALGVLRSPQRQHPGHHAHVVQPGGAVHFDLLQPSLRNGVDMATSNQTTVGVEGVSTRENIK